MLKDDQAFVGARIFDGHDWHYDAALIVSQGRVVDVSADGGQSSGAQQFDLDGGILAPGLIDLQVNGGGGVLLNEQPDIASLKTICRTHLGLGTTSLLPTLITDTMEITKAAIDAGEQAAGDGVDGFIGLHLEGPHLAKEKRGAHDEALMRPMQDQDLADLISAKERLSNLMVTLAPEQASSDQIQALHRAGIVVSLGHSAADISLSRAAIASGARSVTHLYNAMSPLSHREPGLVGAALTSDEVFAGLIADGHHVSPEAITIALRAKRGVGRLFLVSDAMPTVGTGLTEFSLNGRTVFREDKRLSLSDGTLAGADIDLLSAVRFMVCNVGVELGEAVRMASLYPAECIRLDRTHGHLRAGACADFIHLDDDLTLKSVWKAGTAVNVPSGNGG